MRWQLNEAVVKVCETTAMATSSLLPTNPLTSHRQNHQLSLFRNHNRIDSTSKKRTSFRVRAAADLLLGWIRRKCSQNFKPLFLDLQGQMRYGILEHILNKGILRVIGIDVGKDLTIPL